MMTDATIRLMNEALMEKEKQEQIKLNYLNIIGTSETNSQQQQLLIEKQYNKWQNNNLIDINVETLGLSNFEPTNEEESYVLDSLIKYTDYTTIKPV